MEEKDPLFEQVKSYVIKLKEVSCSMIQIEFRLGYNRGGRIVDQLEEAGIIGPFDGTKLRKVLISQSDKAIPPVKNHCTLVCGWDENKKLVYMRTFDYENDKNEKELAQAAFKWCIDNCKGGYSIGDISTVTILQN